MFRDKGLGAKVLGLVFRVWASGCGSWASGLEIWAHSLRLADFGFAAT